ncbi:MAG: cytochrome c oxidase subunit [Acidimicrobiaceae bacterium]|jgi:cytochrome c oxidase subunit 2
MRQRVVLVAGALLLAGCELPSFGAPDAASREGSDVLTLWKGFFVAAMAVGALVLGLIGYVAIRFRRRSDDIPSQKGEHIPLEIFYTVTPILIVAILFGFSVAAEQRITRTSDHPPLTVNVTGFQWGWKFEYPNEKVTVLGTGEREPPELYLPVGQTVRLVLQTTDVNHSFWVPAFLQKRDLIQGVDNVIDITPTQIGRYDGRCAEYCGLDHWRMDFIVNVVSKADFDNWIRSQR